MSSPSTTAYISLDRKIASFKKSLSSCSSPKFILRLGLKLCILGNRNVGMTRGDPLPSLGDDLERREGEGEEPEFVACPSFSLRPLIVGAFKLNLDNVLRSVLRVTVA